MMEKRERNEDGSVSVCRRYYMQTRHWDAQYYHEWCLTVRYDRWRCWWLLHWCVPDPIIITTYFPMFSSVCALKFEGDIVRINGIQYGECAYVLSR